MTPQDRAAVAALCAERAGLRVDPDKEYLLENRLGPVARREGFGALSDMLQPMRDRGDETPEPRFDETLHIVLGIEAPP